MLSSLLGLFFWANTEYLRSEMNRQVLEIPDAIYSEFREEELEVAIIGDMHVGDETADYNRLSLMLEKVVRSKPDLVLLLGDYTASSLWISKS